MVAATPLVEQRGRSPRAGARVVRIPDHVHPSGNHRPPSRKRRRPWPGIRRPRARARGPPPGAHRLLLPDARLGLRGRGRRPGDDGPGVAGHRLLRGPLGLAVVAVPDRHQRLPRHAAGPPAPGPAHGARALLAGRRRPHLGPMLPENAWVRADPRRPGPAHRRRPGRAGRGPGDHPPGLRRRPPAPARPPAGRADPPRGAALAGDRGGRAARHQRGVGQQRPAAGPGHPAAGDLDAQPPARVDAEQQALLARYVDAFERYDMPVARSPCCARTHVQSMPPYRHVAAGPGRDRALDARPGRGCRGSRLLADLGQRLPRLRAVPSRPARAATLPWALQVLEISGGRIAGLHNFLDTELFAAFGLPDPPRAH